MRIRKKVAIDPVEAETARLIFNTYLRGPPDDMGPIGVKRLASWLNANGFRTRNGGLFSTGGLHAILRNTVYIGRWKYNQRNSRTGMKNPESEVVPVEVPAIIDEAIFNDVQSQLKARDRRLTPPRAWSPAPSFSQAWLAAPNVGAP